MGKGRGKGEKRQGRGHRGHPRGDGGEAEGKGKVHAVKKHEKSGSRK